MTGLSPSLCDLGGPSAKLRTSLAREKITDHRDALIARPETLAALKLFPRNVALTGRCNGDTISSITLHQLSVWHREKHYMALVKVKNKYQVTLPASLRQKAGLKIGDFLEAKIEGKKITLTPKTRLDRELTRALREIDEGKTYGPFTSAKDMVRSLDREARKIEKKSA